MANRTKEQDRVYQAKWRENNREKTREKAVRYFQKKKNDPEFRAKHAARYKAWAASNPDGNKERNRRYRKAKPERFAIYEIRKNYKVSLIEAAQLFERRKHGCEVCGSAINPHIDHNHESGKIRGILCGGCNLVIGHSFESPATLRALANYLEVHQSSF